jgi:hypothetical protein
MDRVAKSKVEVVVRLADEAEVDDMGPSVGRKRD